LILGHWNGTLVNGLLHHFKTLSTIGGSDRPGIVHRLDRDTSGLLVIARTDEIHNQLKDLFMSRNITKKYAAIVVGKPNGQTTSNGSFLINKPIGRHPKDINKMIVSEDGKEAITEFLISKSWTYKKTEFSLLDVQIHTGRTHQIRVHLSSIMHPIVGDDIYFKKVSQYKVPYLLLASKFLQFKHPKTGQVLSFEAPLPEHMRSFIAMLNQTDIVSTPNI